MKFEQKFPIILDDKERLLRFQGAPKAVLGKKIKTTEKIGIEVELEQVNIKTNRTNPLLWKPVDDGSLKIRGSEFTICIYSNKVIEAIQNLKDNLDNYDCSLRTSIHIHLDVTNLNLEEVLLLTYLYYIFETPLIRYSGGRFSNNFCVPLSESWTLSPQALLSWKKYNAINVFPSLHGRRDIHYNTIEFRQMRGNLNEKFIQSWANIIIKLKHYVKGKNLNSFLDTLEKANETSSYIILMEEVFGEYSIAINYSNLIPSVEKNILALKSFLYKMGLYDMKEEVLSFNTHHKMTKDVFPFLFDKLNSKTEAKVKMKFPYEKIFGPGNVEMQIDPAVPLTVGEIVRQNRENVRRQEMVNQIIGDDILDIPERNLIRPTATTTANRVRVEQPFPQPNLTRGTR